MRPVRLFMLAVVALALAAATRHHWRWPPSAASLHGQLAGDHCTFEHDYSGCRLISIVSLRFLLAEKHECDHWAVQCLGEMPGQEATAALVGVLATKRDVETCDGVVPVRSAAVELLGRRGDRSAVAALRALLAGPRPMQLSPGAVGCRAGNESDAVVRRAIGQLGG
jgi:hypothetical protein